MPPFNLSGLTQESLFMIPIPISPGRVTGGGRGGMGRGAAILQTPRTRSFSLPGLPHPLVLQVLSWQVQEGSSRWAARRNVILALSPAVSRDASPTSLTRTYTHKLPGKLGNVT